MGALREDAKYIYTRAIDGGAAVRCRMKPSGALDGADFPDGA